MTTVTLPSSKPVQLPLLFLPVKVELQLEYSDRRRLRLATDRLKVGDSLEAKDRAGQVMRVERVDFLYRYGDHFRIFHNGNCFIVQLEGQQPKAFWYLIRYLMAAGIQMETLKTNECDPRCAFDQPKPGKRNQGQMTTPIVLLKKQRGSH